MDWRINLSQTPVWPLRLATGWWSLGPWKAPPGKRVCLPGGFGHLSNDVVYGGGSEPCCTRSHLQRNWRLQALVWPPGRERETEPATWAVCDGVPIKTLDSKGSGELPWLAILSVSHLVARRWLHQWPPWGGYNQKPHGWTPPRLLYFSSLCWL